MAIEKPRTEDLSECAKRWATALRDGNVGPLRVAEEIVAVADAWDARGYRQQAKGLAATTWLRENVDGGKNLAYYRVRAEAVRLLGRVVLNNVHHQVAVWLYRSVPKEKWEWCVGVLVRARKENVAPLSLQQARLVLASVVAARGRVLQPACERCRELEELLRSNGIEFGVNGPG